MDDLELPNEILTQITGTINEHLAKPSTRKALQKEFRHFLTSYVNEAGESIYGEKIRAMCGVNGESLVVSYQHLLEGKVSITTH